MLLQISHNSQEEHLRLSLFFNKITGLKSATLLKKTLALVFSCEFFGICKSTFFRTPLGDWVQLIPHSIKLGREKDIKPEA